MTLEEEYGDEGFDLTDTRPRIMKVIPEMEGNVGYLTFVLSDDRQIILPVDWYTKLKLAGPHDIVVWEIVDDGQMVAWPTINASIHMKVLQEGKSAIR
jgi:hypothetical protein